MKNIGQNKVDIWGVKSIMTRPFYNNLPNIIMKKKKLSQSTPDYPLLLVVKCWKHVWFGNIISHYFLSEMLLRGKGDKHWMTQQQAMSRVTGGSDNTIA